MVIKINKYADIDVERLTKIANTVTDTLAGQTINPKIKIECADMFNTGLARFEDLVVLSSEFDNHRLGKYSDDELSHGLKRVIDTFEKYPTTRDEHTNIVLMSYLISAVGMCIEGEFEEAHGRILFASDILAVQMINNFSECQCR